MRNFLYVYGIKPGGGTWMVLDFGTKEACGAYKKKRILKITDK